MSVFRCKKISNVRFPYLPKLPFASLEELNLRTYVNFKGQKGIFFFTLDSNHLLANFIARNFFNLPYCYRSITVNRNKNLYSSSSEDFKLNARIEGLFKKSEFVNFLVERYFLFTDNSKSVFRGQVFHRPWQFHSMNEIECFETLHQRFNIVGGEYHSAFYSRELDVYFKTFEKLIDL